MPKVLLIFGVALAAAIGLTAGAQETNYWIWVDWRADTYAPSGYAGKVLPVAGSFMEATVFVTETTGQLVDLSKLPIYWYLNDRLLEGGNGKQKIVFLVPEDASRNLKLRARVGGLKNGDAIQTLRLPVAAPDIVIDAPYPSNRFGTTAAEVWARPFFFKIARLGDLGLTWRVNGELVQNAEHPESLRMEIDPNTPDGTAVDISLAAQNPRGLFESAQSAARLIFQK
ncbi:MAG: hypothetical protein HY978_01400 [Candidatus Liptonbacteria bacterium]|nr:hypothetical protein [Candidatus Liptonbacteria bacterium]